MKLSDIKKAGYKRFVRIGNKIIDLSKKYITGVTEESYCLGDDYDVCTVINFASGKFYTLDPDYCDDDYYRTTERGYTYPHFADVVTDLLHIDDIVVISQGPYCSKLLNSVIITEKNIDKYRKLLASDTARVYNVIAYQNTYSYQTVLTVAYGRKVRGYGN